MTIIETLAVTGLLLSAYAIMVKWRASTPGYRALCDIRENISCTKAFTSPYGKLLRVPNAYLGIPFYAALFTAARLHLNTFLLLLAVLGVLASAYLAYLLYFRLKNFCIVCNATYVVNVLLLAAVLSQT